MNSENIKKWFLDNDNKLLFLLMVFTICFKLYYFLKLGSQPIWWDEGDYLAIAKVWALNQPIPEWWAHFTGMRPVLIPLIWAGMFKLGVTEIVLRFFTLLLPSIFSVYLVYAVGRDMYGKKAGLIAGLMMSVYWVFTFYSYRLLTDIPSIFLGMLCMYFFWSIYITKNKNYGLYLSAFFGILAFSTRFPLSLVLISIAIYLLFIKKISLFKDRTIWKAGLVGLLTLSPYLIYFIYTKFYLFQFYFGEGAVSIKQAVQWNIIPMLFSFLNPAKDLTSAQAPIYYSFWGFAFLLGIFAIYKLILGFDIFFHQKDKKFNADFFLLLFLIVHLIFYIIIFRAANDRWLLMLMPPIFILSAKGMQFLYEIIKPYSKEVALFLVALLLFGGVYFNMAHTSSLISQTYGSFGEVKAGGEWVKENSEPDAKVITASIVQNQYYSERDSYDFYVNDSGIKYCWDLNGALNVSNSFCMNETEKRFNEKIVKINPDYYIISAYERAFTPQWAYDYPQRYNLTFLQGFSDVNGNPILIIYGFNKK